MQYLIYNLIHILQVGWTPLHISARNNCRGVVELLLKHGADVNVKAGHKYVILRLKYKPHSYIIEWIYSSSYSRLL